MSLCDLDLDRTMSNVELVQASFTYYNVLKFQIDYLIFLSYVKTHTHTYTHTHTHTHTHTTL